MGLVSRIKFKGMKKTLKINIAFLLLAIVSFAVNADNSNTTDPGMEIKGKISKKGKASGLYKVELVYANTVVDTKFVDDEMSFNFTLPHNRDYLIKIYKKGYTTKTVSVKTNTAKYNDKNGYYKYEFVAEMEEDITLKNLNADSKVGKYDNNAGEQQIGYFDLKRKYCKKVKPLVD